MRINMSLYEIDDHDVYVAESEKQAIDMHREMYSDTDECDCVKVDKNKVLTFDLSSIGGEGVIKLRVSQWMMLVTSPQHLMSYDW